MSKITNKAAVVFFILLQIPLSRLSPGFAFITCFIVWFIDYESKKWAYEISSCIIRLDFEGFKNLFAMELNFDEDPKPMTKSKKSDIHAVADWFCLHFVMMMSIMLNYSYRVSVEAVVESAAHWVILISDAIGIDMHFIRFLYWSLLD